MTPKELAKETEDEREVCQMACEALNKATQEAIAHGATLTFVEGNNLVRVNYSTGTKEILKKLPPRRKIVPGIYKLKKY